MCYNARYLLEKALKRARYFGVADDINKFEKALERYDELYQVSGFSHPEIIIYTNDKPYEPKLAKWGLIPHWVKSSEQAQKIWNQTINARAESIFEKPSFRDAAITKRCIIPADGFYEHHHFKNKKYPFYITRKDNEPLYFAGLWSEWTDKQTGELIATCSIITTKANSLMQKIHNNSKLNEARMPVILPDGLEEAWLKPIKTDADKKVAQQLLIPFPEEMIRAHTVKRLSGKDSPGNVPDANEEFIYPELDTNWLIA